MTQQYTDNFRTAEEAALWLQRLRNEDTPEVRAEFSAWIKKAAANLEEFLFAQAAWAELDHIDTDLRNKMWPESVSPPIAPFRARNAPASRTPAIQPSLVRPASRRRWIIRAAAGIAVVSLGWALSSLFWGAQIYNTAVGDQKAIKLSDGSVMHLNTHSRAEVRYSKQSRTVHLITGEALFTIEADATRPFYVLTDRASIRVLGTQFNVYRGGEKTTRVAVVEGAVQVSSLSNTAETAHRNGSIGVPAADRTTRMPHDAIKLVAGDEARIDRAGIVKTASPNIQRAVAWRERRLIFPGDRIADIADEFNRYNRVQIRVDGEALRNRKMSGVFDADDPSTLLQHLSRDPEVVVVKTPDEILIRSRALN